MCFHSLYVESNTFLQHIHLVLLLIFTAMYFVNHKGFLGMFCIRKLVYVPLVEFPDELMHCHNGYLPTLPHNDYNQTVRGRSSQC